MTIEDWFQVLAEAADLMLKKKISPGLGSVKIRMKMLNPNFNEKKLSFSQWSDFVSAAVKAGFVTIAGKGAESVIYPVPKVLKERARSSGRFRSSSTSSPSSTRETSQTTTPSATSIRS